MNLKIYLYKGFDKVLPSNSSKVPSLIVSSGYCLCEV